MKFPGWRAKKLVFCHDLAITSPLSGTQKANMIDAQGLAKTFKDPKRGTFRAVDGVSFKCEPGRIYGLLGANGAGKTTTLRMLATLLRPSDGSALVAGHDIKEHPEKVRANIGFLSTATALYGRLNARETIEYFGRLNGLEEAALRQRVEELVTLLEIAEFADRRCDKLSTGQKQRISIARTLVHDPQVMIFDEPTHGLDLMTARTIVGFIKQCRDRGKTVIFSSHIMSEVERLCDRIGIIHNGKLLVDGTVEELRSQTGLQELEDIFVHYVESQP